MVLSLVAANPVPERPLEVGVEVHFNGAVAERFADFLARGTGTAVEDEIHRLRPRAEFFLDEVLRVFEDDGLQLDVAGLVNPVDVAEGGRDREVRADFQERLVGEGDFLGLGVEAGFVHSGIVHAVFLAAGDTEFDFERHAELGHARQVFRADLDVLRDRLLGKVEHVRAVERRAGFGELLFAGGQHAVHPGQKLLRAMVGVQDERNSVGLGGRIRVMGSGDAAEDRAELVLFADALADKELGSAVRELDHHRGVDLTARRQRGVDRVRVHAVHCRQGEFVRLRVVQHFFHFIAEQNSGPEFFLFTHSIN